MLQGKHYADPPKRRRQTAPEAGRREDDGRGGGAGVRAAVQPSLFDNPPPREAGRARRHDPDTAKKAAAAAPVAELEGRVLRLLRTSGGMTTHELAKALFMDLVSISPRMRPLVEKGLARDSGERRCGESGRSSIVWKAI
jgi:hypothetical protein